MRIVNSIFSIVLCLAKLLYFNNILYFVFISVCLFTKQKFNFVYSFCFSTLCFFMAEGNDKTEIIG